MSKKDVIDKVPIYKLKTTEDIMKHYDMWGDKYDKDMVEWNYTGPQETVNIFKKHTLSKDIKIFDAGCGTGLVGIELKKFGYTNIDGADLSKKLLDLIPNGFYNKLEQIDLNKPLNKKKFTTLPAWAWIDNKEIKISSTEIRKQRELLRGKN